MRGSGDYDRKKKDTVVCLAGCAVVSVFGSGGKLAVFVVVAGKFYYDWKKKRYSCLSGGCTIIITTGRKRYSCLSVGCVVLAITTGKKNDTVVCLTGCAVVLFFVVAGNFDYDRKKKKIQSSVGVKLAVFLLWREIFILTGKKKIHYDQKKKIQSSV